MAAKMLVDATVRAPFAGTISERLVNVGEYVQPPTRVAVLVELSPLRLQFGLDEAQVGRVREGQEVTFEVEAFPGETFTAVVKYLDPSVRAMTRDMVVEALVANADRRLRTGMFVTAHLRLEDAPAVAVPKSAIDKNASATRVFAVIDRMIQERIVQVGAERDGKVAVLDGLKDGERVVVSLGNQVKDGVPVK
jgi:RND family efflux transporter MFP subunit